MNIVSTTIVNCPSCKTKSLVVDTIAIEEEENKAKLLKAVAKCKCGYEPPKKIRPEGVE